MAQAAEQMLDRWSGGVCPFEAGWRKVMMWAFIITDGLLFAGLLGSYGYARIMSARWPDQAAVFDLRLIALMTFILISSSATMANAVGAARDEGARRSVSLRWLLLTILGGAAFLGMQAYEWTHLIGAGARLDGNPWGDPLFASYFFILTGFHGTHVLIGVIVLTALAIRWQKRLASREGVELAGLYWHFVDLVWVFIFTLFYLV
ncbi:MAG: cytochrome c oxidase subunit 3 [Acidobacteria bacterium]|nr:cytochrome c oxidase subunit 3 [Acidobacteriota bacterium]